MMMKSATKMKTSSKALIQTMILMISAIGTRRKMLRDWTGEEMIMIGTVTKTTTMMTIRNIQTMSLLSIA
jgi:hypothetical protein